MTRLAFSLLFLFAPAALSFAPIAKVERPTTAIHLISRRDSVAAAAAAFVGCFVDPQPSIAFSQQLDDYLVEPAQMGTGGKFDLNAAGVVSTTSCVCL